MRKKVSLSKLNEILEEIMQQAEGQFKRMYIAKPFFYSHYDWPFELVKEKE